MWFICFCTVIVLTGIGWVGSILEKKLDEINGRLEDIKKRGSK